MVESAWPVATYFTKEEALKARKEYEYIFGEEISLKEKKQKFHVGTHIDLFRVFLTSPTQRFHEFRFPDLPIKLVFDLEKEREIMKKAEFEEHVFDILLKLEEKVFGTPVMFDCSRDVKNSMHIIYPRTVFRNLKEMEVFIATYFKSNPIIDYNIYKTSGMLRVPFATSFNAAPHKLLPFGQKDDKFSLELFKLGILHYYELAFFWNNNSYNKKKVNTLVLPSNVVLSKYQELIYRWAFLKGYRIAGYKEQSSGELQIYVKGMKCPKKGKPHKSNSISISINLGHPCLPSTLRCLDADCKDVKWHGPHFSTVLRVAELKKELGLS